MTFLKEVVSSWARTTLKFVNSTNETNIKERKLSLFFRFWQTSENNVHVKYSLQKRLMGSANKTKITIIWNQEKVIFLEISYPTKYLRRNQNTNCLLFKRQYLSNTWLIIPQWYSNYTVERMRENVIHSLQKAIVMPLLIRNCKVI